MEVILQLRGMFDELQYRYIHVSRVRKNKELRWTSHVVLRVENQKML